MSQHNKELYLYNTLTHKKELFSPMNSELITMYVCGPTVYDRAHIGNARSCVIYDVLYRTLGYCYEGLTKVKYCRNITDIDDKIINRAIEQNTTAPLIVEKYTALFHDDMKFLGCLSPTMEPRATEHIDEIVNIIQILMSKGVAYKGRNNDIFFNISKYTHYGKFSGRNLESQIIGARIEENSNKENAEDFVLWKTLNHDELNANEAIKSVYDSPFGKGRPGWHIECSAMTYKNFGHTFDIHGGGVDLKFPHHENEIAQSCCAYTEGLYARYWVHNGFLMVNGQKMSKSLGNFLTIEDIQKRGLSGELIRYIFLMTHYRNKLNWSDDLIQNAKNNLAKIKKALSKCDESILGNKAFPPTERSEFYNYLLDDLNTGSALLYLQRITNDILDGRHEYIPLVKECLDFLGINKENLLSEHNKKASKQYNIKLINSLIGARNECKANKDFEGADRIRDAALEIGVRFVDYKDRETEWEAIEK